MRSYNACIKVTLQSTQCALPVYLFHTQYLRPADTYASEHVLRPDVSDARKSVDVKRLAVVHDHIVALPDNRVSFLQP